MKQFEKTWRPLARSCEQSARLAKVYEKNLSAPEVTATQIQTASEPGQNATQKVTDTQIQSDSEPDQNATQEVTDTQTALG